MNRNSNRPTNKVEAVYQLREAAEAHGRAALLAEAAGTPAARDALLDAKERLEAKTIEAIVACEHCAQVHCDDPAHKAGTVVPLRLEGPAGQRYTDGRASDGRAANRDGEEGEAG